MKREELLTEILVYIAKNHGGKQNRFADSIGVSCAYVSDIVNGKKEPSKKILELIGVVRTVTYKKINHKKGAGS